MAGTDDGSSREAAGGAPDAAEAGALARILERLDRLEWRMARLEAAHGAAPPARGAPVPAQAAARTGEPGPAQPAGPPGQALPGETWLVVDDPGQENRASRDLEEILGANWLAKAGVALVTLGMVFLFQHAVAQGWLGLSLQVLLGVVAGFLMFLLGDHLFARKGMVVYGQVLQGGGAAIAYFSIFASYAFEPYHVATGVTLEAASLLLGAVAAMVLLNSFWRRAPVLASVAMVLGAATVVFAGNWPLFAVAYVLILTAAVLGAAIWRNWVEVAWVATLSGLGSLFIGVLVSLQPGAGVWAALGVAVAVVVAAQAVRWRLLSVTVLPVTGLVLAGAVFQVPETALLAGTLLGILGAVVFSLRGWLEGQPIGLATAYLLLFLAGGAGLGEPEFAVSPRFPGVFIAAVLLLAVAFSGAALWLTRKGPVSPRRYFEGMVLATVLGAWLLVVFAVETSGWSDATGWLTLAGAVVLLALSSLPVVAGPVRMGWLLSGIAMALVWPPVLLSGAWVGMVWSFMVATVALFQLGRPGLVVRTTLGVAALLTTFHVVVLDSVRVSDGEITWSLGLLVFAVACGALSAAWWSTRHSEVKSLAGIAWFYLGAAALVPLVYMGNVLDGYWISVGWAVEALLLVSVGFLARTREFRLTGLGVFAFVLVNMVTRDLIELDPGLRIVSFIVVGLLVLVAAYVFAHRFRTETGDTLSGESMDEEGRGPSPP